MEIMDDRGLGVRFCNIVGDDAVEKRHSIREFSFICNYQVHGQRVC